MQNVEVQIEGTKLVATIDLTKNMGRSKTGKSDIIASSGGWQTLDVPVTGDDGTHYMANFLVIKK